MIEVDWELQKSAEKFSLPWMTMAKNCVSASWLSCSPESVSVFAGEPRGTFDTTLKGGGGGGRNSFE